MTSSGEKPWKRPAGESGATMVKGAVAVPSPLSIRREYVPGDVWAGRCRSRKR